MSSILYQKPTKDLAKTILHTNIHYIYQPNSNLGPFWEVIRYTLKYAVDERSVTWR